MTDAGSIYIFMGREEGRIMFNFYILVMLRRSESFETLYEEGK